MNDNYTAEKWENWGLSKFFVKLLYTKGYSKERILESFRFIDWLLVLPVELEYGFSEVVRQYEEDINMPYVTSIERRGIQQGIEQGILQTSRENVIEILAVRFESVPAAIEQAVESIEDLAILKMLHKKAATVASMAEFESIINNL